MYLFHISAKATLFKSTYLFKNKTLIGLECCNDPIKWRDVRRCANDGNVINTRNSSGTAHVIKMCASDINVTLTLKGLNS